MEKIFFYNNTRCHAKIVEKLHGTETYIGKLEGYEKNPHSLFDQFGFITVPAKRQKPERK